MLWCSSVPNLSNLLDHTQQKTVHVYDQGKCVVAGWAQTFPSWLRTFYCNDHMFHLNVAVGIYTALPAPGWQVFTSSAEHADSTMPPNTGLDRPLKIKSRARCYKEVKYHMDPFREMRWKCSNAMQLQHGKTVSCGFKLTHAYIK